MEYKKLCCARSFLSNEEVFVQRNKIYAMGRIGNRGYLIPVAKLIVPDWGRKLTPAKGCLTDPPGYIG